MDRDNGMTVIEVVVALTILMIGAAFVFSGNKVVFEHKANHELRQQMFFYAAGLVEAALEGDETLQGILEEENINRTIEGISADDPLEVEDVEGLEDYLDMVTITVESETNPNIEPIVIKTMRLKP